MPRHVARGGGDDDSVFSAHGLHLAVAACLTTTVWVIAALRWAHSDTVVPWDSKNQFFAFYRFLADSLHAGTTTFWNPYHYGGHPSIADPQSLLFSPAFLISAWLNPAPSLEQFDRIVFAHLLVGGLAIVIMGWRKAWPAPASVLAASVFMLGGAASARLNHTGIIVCYGIFPAALLTLEVALERRSRMMALLFALIASTIALGRNQVAFMLSLALLAWAAKMVLSDARPLRYLRERLGIVSIMVGVACLLITVPVLLTLQLAMLSNRPATRLAEALQASLHPSNLLSLVAPNVFGSHDPDGSYWGPNYATVPAVAATDDSFNYLFVGVVPMLLLLWLGIVGGRALAPGRRAWSALLAVALLFALGRYTPLYALAFEHFPVFSFFRRPIDAVFLVGFAIAGLSGSLLADYVARGLPRPRPVWMLLLAVLIAALAASAVSVAAITGHAGRTAAEIARAAPIVLLVAVVLTLARTARQRTTAASVVMLVAAAELLYWNAASRLNSEGRAYYQVLEGASPADTEALNILTREMERRHHEGARPRVEIVGLGGPWQNLAIVRKLEATTGYNPLRIGIYDRYISPGEMPALASAHRFTRTFDRYDCVLARALGLEYLVLGAPLEQMAQFTRPPRAELLLGGPKIWIYRIPGAMPRVKFSARVELARLDALNAAGDLLNPPDPQRAVLDDATQAHLIPPLRWGKPHLQGAGSARITAWYPGRIEIEVNAPSPGVVVLNDIYYPGWIAEVDGRRSPVLRADVLFRGVEVAEGTHRVVFRFAPLMLPNLLDAVRMLSRWGSTPPGDGRLAGSPTLR